MHEIEFDEILDQIIAKDPRYAREAYHFVREALDYTQAKVSRQSHGRLRHVTGQELLEGIREYALTQFGPMALFVLNEWGVHKTEDFGEIVFNMVEAGLLAKTDEDKKEDFAHGYDFEEVFRKPFLPRGKSQLITPTAPEKPKKTQS